MFNKKLDIPLCDLKCRKFEEMSPLRGFCTFGAKGRGKKKLKNIDDLSSSCKQVADLSRSSSRNMLKVINKKSEGRSRDKENINQHGTLTNVEVSYQRSFRKRVVKPLSQKSKESSSDKENGGGDDEVSSSVEESFGYEYSTNWSNSTDEERSSQDYISNNTPKCEYEKMVEKNKAERMAFLQSLKMDEAKADILQALDSMKPKKVQQVKRNFVKNERPSPVVLRNNRNLANVCVNLTKDSLLLKASQRTKKKKAQKS